MGSTPTTFLPPPPHSPLPRLLIQFVNGLKQRVQSYEKMGDWRHLFTDGVATDCTIQVHITNDAASSSSAHPGPPPAKRARTTHGASEAAASSSEGGGHDDGDVVPAAHTIKAHSFILSSRSEYFKAVLMRGQWAESQDKIIEVELPSEEGESMEGAAWLSACCSLRRSNSSFVNLPPFPPTCLPLSLSALETFKLLVELSYGVDYTRRPSDSNSPSTTFDPNTLVQLISVANMFEFLPCIESCCEVLYGMEGWDVDMALSLINALISMADIEDRSHALIRDFKGQQSCPYKGL